jgi:hypothetical protein
MKNLSHHIDLLQVDDFIADKGDPDVTSAVNPFPVWFS